MGLGWSDDAAGRRDARATALRLERMLDRLEVSAPLILVGHSIASLYLRVFAGLTSRKVAGMALLDPSHPKQSRVLGETGFTRLARAYQYMSAGYAALGIPRLVPPRWELSRLDFTALDRLSREQILFLMRRPHTFLTPLRESDQFECSATQALESPALGDVPLLVVSATEPVRPAGNSSAARNAVRRFADLHKDLLNWSGNSRHELAAGASHTSIITCEPIAKEVCRLIRQFLSNA